MKEIGKILGLILILKRYEHTGNQRKWCKNLWRKEIKIIGNIYIYKKMLNKTY